MDLIIDEHIISAIFIFFYEHGFVAKSTHLKTDFFFIFDVPTENVGCCECFFMNSTMIE